MGVVMPRCTDKLDDEKFVEELRRVFDTDGQGNLFYRETGEVVEEFHWSSGYIGVAYKDRRFMKHRVMYALINGPFYSHLDHINRVKTDNRDKNLRICCQGLNVANANMRSDNTTGYMGVIWHKASNKWQAQTMLKGKRIHIGLFNSKDEAALAYNYKLTELFGYQCTFNKVFEDHPDALTEECY
jgi:hypothetical protein